MHFPLTTLEGVQGSNAVLSETIHISGLSSAAPITVTGGEYSVDGGAFTAQPGTISNGQSVQMRATAPVMPFSSTVAYLRVGMLTQAFRVISGPAALIAQADVAAGFDHSLALRVDGTVWAWGDNSYGQLGDGTTQQQSTPVAIAVPAAIRNIFVGTNADFSLAITVNGALLAWGRNNRGQLGDGSSLDRWVPAATQGTTNLARASAGGTHSLGLKK